MKKDEGALMMLLALAAVVMAVRNSGAPATIVIPEDEPMRVPSEIIHYEPWEVVT